MPPCCAVVSLVLGLAAILLFCVGFGVPYWFWDAGSNGSSHGIWQRRECPSGSCDTTGIDFGVTAAFEAGRVFSCATILMSLVSFIFNVILIKRASKAWAIRTAAVWGCTAVFNLLEALLIGLTERETLDKLTLIGVNTSGDIGSRLEYGYWVTIASLIIFVFLTILCGVLACNMQVNDDDKSETSLTRRLRNSRPMESSFNQIGMYHGYPRDGVSMVTTKTGEPFPPDMGRTGTTQASQYTLDGLGSYQMVQPTRADNQKMRLNVDDGSRYISPPVHDDYNTIGSGTFILNRPTVSPGGDSAYTSGTAISIRKQGDANQDNVYSLNVTPSGIATPSPQVTGVTAPRVTAAGGQQQLNVSQLPIAASAAGRSFRTGGDVGPPAYTTLPRDQQPSITFVSNSNQPLMAANNTTANIYPNIH